MEYRTASHVAGLIGMGLVAVFGICGFVAGLWTLPLIAAFVFTAPRREVQFVMQQA